MDSKEKIIQTIRIMGPVIPAQIAKVIGTDIMMASAVLSELVSKNILKISHVKFGSTPLYYLPGQESRLQDFAKNLHEKEKRAYDLLMQKKVMKDKLLEPVIRVALRNIKDFAIPLQVKINDNIEIFWKWYITTNEEAGRIIKEMVKLDKPKKEIKPVQETITSKEQEKPRKEQKEIKREELKERLPEKEEKKTFIDKTAEDAFLNEIKGFLEKNNIELIEEKIVKKKSDLDLVIEVPSAVGSLTYYCKAKSKKRISDSDLSSAFVQGQLKKLPVLFLIKGDLTKKAKEMLSKEFKNIKIKKI
ncbi:MAG: hypothetical protein KJ968_00250 [Nanoarchaeota archaeon]|nr:hypothetical protein [Nanoarchaeota archaeon]MBU4283518.1 hypothetical protein [Nanoarchaeota archaeon]